MGCEEVAYYFSTHGWTLGVSFTGAALVVPFVAAASLRAFRSKNDAILTRFVGVSWGRMVVELRLLMVD